MMVAKKCSFLKTLCAIGAMCGFALAGALRAEDTAIAFNAANRLYEQQKFSEAAAAYEKIIQSGAVSAPLYFNLGNAHFKAGNTGRAIAAYRNAQKIAPRDPDVRANLRFARDTVQNARPPKSNVWTQLLDRLTLNEWSVFSAVSFLLIFALLTIGQLKREWAKPTRFYALIAAAAAVFFILCTTFAAQRHFTRAAVVAVDEAVLRRGPFDESQSAFALRNGAELTVLDMREHWLQVADTANRIGWLRDSQVAVVR